MSKNLHNLFYDEIIIGASLSALLYSYTTGAPIFFAKLNRPHRFDFFDKEQTISLLPQQSNLFNSPAGEVSTGQQKLLLWEKLYFILNLCGLAPSAHMADSLRLADSELKIFNEYSKIGTVNFNKAIVFDAQGTNLKLKKEPSEFMVLDWISTHSGGRHNVDLIETGDSFVSKLWFYDSIRVPSKIKDICAISIIKEGDIDSFEYSDTYARFKVENLMKEHNMKGASNGIDKKTGKNKHYAIKTSCSSREKIILHPADIVESLNIKMNKSSEKDLMLNFRAAGGKIDSIVSKLCI